MSFRESAPISTPLLVPLPPALRNLKMLGRKMPRQMVFVFRSRFNRPEQEKSLLRSPTMGMIFEVVFPTRPTSVFCLCRPERPMLMLLLTSDSRRVEPTTCLTEPTLLAARSKKYDMNLLCCPCLVPRKSGAVGRNCRRMTLLLTTLVSLLLLLVNANVYVRISL